MAASKEQLDEIALSRKEYNLIVEKLGRQPNEVEPAESCIVGQRLNVPMTRLGTTGGIRFIIKDMVNLKTSELQKAWGNSL